MSWGFGSFPSHFEIIGAVDAERAKPGRGVTRAKTSPFCNRSYEANMRVRPYRDDLAFLEPVELRERLGLRPEQLDVLISCAPCTGFSQKMAVNHLQDDSRNSLVGRTARFVAALRPAVVVMENVKELLRGRQSHHFDSLRSELHALGYEIWAGLHDLSDFGLPQRRLRTIVLATRDQVATPLVTEAPNQRTTVRDAIAHLPPIAQGETDDDDPMHTCPRHTPQVTARMRAIPKDGGSWGDLVRSHPELLIPSMINKRRGSFPDVYGRMWWDRPAVTITRECGHPGNGRYTHPDQDRMLSVREMALLQGFPPEYEFLGPMNARYNQIGDAVPPLVARRIAAHVASVLATPASAAIQARARLRV